MKVRSILPALILFTGLVPGAGTSVSAATAACAGDGTTIQSTDSLLGLPGRYVLPTGTATSLVVMAHGYGNSSAAWVNHLTEAASHGAIAVAMDYSGLGPAPDYRGWPAATGARDLVAAGTYFKTACNLPTAAIIGVSMGGNMSGLAVAAGARIGGAPVFDYWVDVEGATNMSETYHEATLVSPANTYAANVKQDMEQECGGTSAQQTQCYLARSVVFQSGAIAASGLSGVTVVHALADGLVPTDQGREMSTALRLLGLPVDHLSVLRRNNGESQTTLLSYAGLGAYDPLAGHQWEGGEGNVIRAGLEAVWNDIDPAGTRPANRERVVDPAATVP